MKVIRAHCKYILSIRYPDTNFTYSSFQYLVKSEIKGMLRALKDEAVEAILQEAAEAFAIERAKKEVGYQVPSIEEIARACDPIGKLDCISVSVQSFLIIQQQLFYLLIQE